MTIDEILAVQPVVPVMTIDHAGDAVQAAEILVAAGLPVLEVTLRTQAALDAIRRMSEVNGAIVGAGTILTPMDVDAAAAAGARIVVTPGLTAATVEASRRCGIPVLPGVMTSSDIMRGLDIGIERFKFFPAEQAGGLHMLAALEGPFGRVKFCPTGGISLDLAAEYLKRPNVVAVGGGWIAPRNLVREHAWDDIRFNAIRAAALKRP